MYYANLRMCLAVATIAILFWCRDWYTSDAIACSGTAFGE
jgi:hypothetical protein